MNHLYVTNLLGLRVVPQLALPHSAKPSILVMTCLSLLAALISPFAGCSTIKSSTMYVSDYREAGEAKRYRETFDEGYYDIDELGNVNIVLRRIVEGKEGPGHEIIQVVHLRTVWRSIPGRTIAHDTQINGMVSYYIITGQAGAAFEGAGSIFVKKDRHKPIIIGTLDGASLKPTRRLLASHNLFKQARISATFHANKDRRRVIGIINQLNSRFGTTSNAKG